MFHFTTTQYLSSTFTVPSSPALGVKSLHRARNFAATAEPVEKSTKWNAIRSGIATVGKSPGKNESRRNDETRNKERMLSVARGWRSFARLPCVFLFVRRHGQRIHREDNRVIKHDERRREWREKDPIAKRSTVPLRFSIFNARLSNDLSAPVTRWLIVSHERNVYARVSRVTFCRYVRKVAARYRRAKHDGNCVEFNESRLNERGAGSGNPVEIACKINE